MRAALRAELVKLSRRPAVWLLLAILVTSQVLFGHALLYLAGRLDPGSQPAHDGWIREVLSPQRFVGVALQGLAGLGATLALILGVLAWGSEYRWGTVKTMATQGPTRPALGGGKAAAVAAVGLGFTVASFAAALLSSVVIARVERAPVVWPAAGTVFAGLGAGWLVLLTWSALGMFLAVALRGTGLAVGLGLAYGLIVETMALALPFPERISDALRMALVGPNASALAQHFAVRPPVPGMLGDQVPPGQAAAVLAAYCLLFLVLGGALFARRDIA